MPWNRTSGQSSLQKKYNGNDVGLIYTPDSSPNAYGKAKAGR